MNTCHYRRLFVQQNFTFVNETLEYSSRVPIPTRRTCAQEIINESHETVEENSSSSQAFQVQETLVGIRLSYESEFSELATTRLVARKWHLPRDHTTKCKHLPIGKRPACCGVEERSGFGSATVQDVRKYVQHHESGDKRVPLHHVIIFDEAQRAWDKGKVERRHKG